MRLGQNHRSFSHEEDPPISDMGERQFIVSEEDGDRRGPAVDLLKFPFHDAVGLPERLTWQRAGLEEPEESLMERSRDGVDRFDPAMTVVDAAEEPELGTDLDDMPIFHPVAKADIRDLV